MLKATETRPREEEYCRGCFSGTDASHQNGKFRSVWNWVASGLKLAVVSRVSSVLWWV